MYNSDKRRDNGSKPSSLRASSQRMSVLSLLQIAHLALLFVIPISFALLRLISGSEDATVKKLGVVVGLGGG